MHCLTIICASLFFLLESSSDPCTQYLPPSSLCTVPFSVQDCSYCTKDRLKCEINPLHRSRLWQCDNSTWDDPFLFSNNFLILHPPFIEVLLHRSTQKPVLFLFFVVPRSEISLSVDLRPLIDIHPQPRIWIVTRLRKGNTRLVFKTYPRFDLYFYRYSDYRDSWLVADLPSVERNSFTRDGTQCHFVDDGLLPNVSKLFADPYVALPSEECATYDNESRVRIRSTPCFHVGDFSFLCRVDRLRSDDRFTRTTLPYLSHLTIITNDPGRNTQHVFSEHLVRACIARHLVVVVIDGRLKIPSMNVSVFTCADGTVRGAKKLWK